MTVVVLLGLLGFAEFFLVSFVSPAYPRERLLPTPTLDLLATPTPSLEPFTTQDASLLGAMATPVVSEEQGCIAGQLEWIAPLSGDEISGSVELMGTVNMADLSFYKYEFAPAGSDTWETIAAGDSTRIEENLGGEGSLWYIGDKTPGDYQLRIVAINRQNVALPACTISVRIVAPES
ncbi:MAG: hypothetical protein GYA17_16865 [Chloroflexi bacterium]|nr:hypothetical protein [Anaerolineaceae bacterium]NMB90031.1 hypothetical protein [Chloroflexota bacterium]